MLFEQLKSLCKCRGFFYKNKNLYIRKKRTPTWKSGALIKNH